jgi:Mycobacterium membrane protein
MLVILKKAWVALVVVMVVSLGSIGVLKLRGVFGSDPIFSATASQAEQLPQVNVKHVMYEVFGPSDTAGSVSYVDKDSRPGQANFSSLPWRYTIATTMSSVIANVVAQGDSSSLGCRITINGEVKDEHYSFEHHAQASCLVKAA